MVGQVVGLCFLFFFWLKFSMDFTVVTGQAICLWKFCRGWLIKYLGLREGGLNTYTLNSTLVFSHHLRDLVDVFMFLDTHCSPHRLTDQCAYNSALRKSWLCYFLNRGFGNLYCEDSYFFWKCYSRVFCFTCSKKDLLSGKGNIFCYAYMSKAPFICINHAHFTQGSCWFCCPHQLSLPMAGWGSVSVLVFVHCIYFLVLLITKRRMYDGYFNN